MKIHRWCIGWGVYFLLLPPVFAGAPPQDPCRRPFDDAKITRCLRLSEELVLSGQHEEAASIYRTLLEVLDVFPLSFCYYFSSSLYHTGHYPEAISLLSYYVRHARAPLAGASALLQEMRAAFSAIRNCSLCDASGRKYIAHPLCAGTGRHISSCPSCGGSGQRMCPRCRGQGVNIAFGIFYRKKYHRCDTCKASGRVLCGRCDGAGTVVLDCKGCHGAGKIPSTALCPHEP